jgi:hypothetical protein
MMSSEGMCGTPGVSTQRSLFLIETMGLRSTANCDQRKDLAETGYPDDHRRGSCLTQK